MNSISPRVLFVGDGWLGSNARSLAEGFRQAGADVILVDTTSTSRPRRLSPSWTFSKVKSGKRSPWSVAAIHDQIDEISNAWNPDILFCFKTIHLDQERLLSNAAKIKVHYSADDVSNAYNTTNEYLKYESAWDLVVTTKKHNMDELAQRGAKRTLMVMSAFDPAWHHLSARRTSRQFQVGFVGNYREDRKNLLVELGSQFGSNLIVEGPGWSRVPELVRTNAVVGSGKYGEDFSIAVASIVSNLVLLNSDNRDTHTCRSFEVPASGGLFVGQRTAEHQEILEENKECLLFSTEDELFAHLHEIKNDSNRAQVLARAGHDRILRDGHRYVDRAREILEFLDAK
ncbi:CgeB family protein [Arthrobacter sp. 35W]|uniref:CgeB family protein n=1 Tax=Arthrobacter sp. 35W TaxID=1132441 RepID=UPI0018C98FFA|nr:glycosyltransferase [Arthrobacter sp. 35W]